MTFEQLRSQTTADAGIQVAKDRPSEVTKVVEPAALCAVEFCHDRLHRARPVSRGQFRDACLYLSQALATGRSPVSAERIAQKGEALDAALHYLCLRRMQRQTSLLAPGPNPLKTRIRFFLAATQHDEM